MSFCANYNQSNKNILKSLQYTFVKDWEFILNIFMISTEFLNTKFDKSQIEKLIHETTYFYKQFKQYYEINNSDIAIYYDNNDKIYLIENLNIIKIEIIDYINEYKEIFDAILEKINKDLEIKKEYTEHIENICNIENKKLITLLNKYEQLKQTLKKEEDVKTLNVIKIEKLNDELVGYQNKLSEGIIKIENQKNIKKTKTDELMELNIELQTKKTLDENKLFIIEEKLFKKTIHKEEYQRLRIRRTELINSIKSTHDEIHNIQKELATLERQIIMDNNIIQLECQIKEKTKYIHNILQFKKIEQNMVNLKDEINKCKDMIKKNELIFLKKEQELIHDQDIIFTFQEIYSKYNEKNNNLFDNFLDININKFI